MDQAREVRLFPTSSNDEAISLPRALEGVRAYRDAGWSMARIGDEIFVVYVEPELGDQLGDHTPLRAQRVTYEGDEIDEPLTLAEGRFLRRVVVRTDGRSPARRVPGARGREHRALLRGSRSR